MLQRRDAAKVTAGERLHFSRYLFLLVVNSLCFALHQVPGRWKKTERAWRILGPGSARNQREPGGFWVLGLMWQLPSISVPHPVGDKTDHLSFIEFPFSAGLLRQTFYPLLLTFLQQQFYDDQHSLSGDFLLEFSCLSDIFFFPWDKSN